MLLIEEFHLFHGLKGIIFIGMILISANEYKRTSTSE